MLLMYAGLSTYGINRIHIRYLRNPMHGIMVLHCRKCEKISI